MLNIAKYMVKKLQLSVSLMANMELLHNMFFSGGHQVDPLTGTEDPPAGQWSSDRFVLLHVFLC